MTQQATKFQADEHTQAMIDGELVAVRIIGADSDPSCAVWVCEVADPDAGHMLPRAAFI